MFQLAADGARVASQLPGNLSLRESRTLRSERGQSISLFGGDLLITHDGSFLAEDVVSVSDRPQLHERALHLLLEYAWPNNGMQRTALRAAADAER